MNVIVPTINSLRPLIPTGIAGYIMYRCLNNPKGNLVPEEEQPRFVKNAGTIARIAMNVLTITLCLSTLYLDNRWAVFTVVSLIWPKKVQEVVNTIVEIFTNYNPWAWAFIGLGEFWLKIYAVVPLTAAISWAYLGSRIVGTAINMERERLCRPQES